jgi:hypothetical protein
MALLGTSALSCFELRGDLYVPLGKPWFEAAQLGLTLWRGKFEEQEGEWLRWCREDGSLIPTGAERADRAEVRAERMADKLRALGIDPEER